MIINNYEPRAYTYIRHRMAIEKAYSSNILTHHHALETSLLGVHKLGERREREVRTMYLPRK
jgi:hypothetical protein